MGHNSTNGHKKDTVANDVDLIQNSVDNKLVPKKMSYKYLLLLVLLTITLITSAMYLSKLILNQIENDDIYMQNRDNSNNIIGKKKDDDNKDNSQVVFSYYEKQSIGNGVKLVDQLPISDEVGRALVGDYHVFNFRLNFNKNALGLVYVIVVEKLPDSDLSTNYVKMYLESGAKVLDGILRSDESVKIFNDYNQYTKNDNERILYKGTVSKTDIYRGYRDFVFKMWASNDMDVDIEEYSGKTFGCRINVYARSTF